MELVREIEKIYYPVSTFSIIKIISRTPCENNNRVSRRGVKGFFSHYDKDSFNEKFANQCNITF